MDEQLFRSLYAANGGVLTRVAAAFTVLGDGWVVLALVPFLASRRHHAPARALVFVLAVTAAVVATLKLAVQRVRPCHALLGVRCLWGSAPTDFSFPSGHAAGSFAFAAFVGGLALSSAESSLRPALRVALVAVGLLVATCIAGSRVVLGVHFPGDVAAGSLLGAAIGSWGARVHLRKRAPKAAPTTSPEPAPRRPLLDDGRSPKTGRFARGACRRRPC